MPYAKFLLKLGFLLDLFEKNHIFKYGFFYSILIIQNSI
jgi:hypothetical protein